MDASTSAMSLSGLSGSLHEQFVDWLDRRKPQEEEFLRCYNDNMRISRGDDTTETGISRAQKSKVFIGSTRSKIRSARAKIKDALFGAGQMPFDTKPSNESLKDYADTVEAILENQFEEGDFKKTLVTGVDSICVYGTGFIFGPFVKKKTHTTVQPQVDANGLQQLKEVAAEYDCPYYEHGRTMDCYPDPEAEDVREGRGIYWASRKTKEFIKALKGKPGYSDAAIDRACVEKVTSSTSEGSDRTADARMNLYRYTKEGRIWFVRYFGLVKREELTNWRRDSLNDAPEEDVEQDDDDDLIECVIITAGGQVIKAEPNPYKEKKRPVRRCVYEEVEHEMWGVGIAKNNDPHQRVTNAAFRLFIEGKAYALLKMFSADRGAFEVTEDFKLFPGKRFQFKPGLTPEQRKDAIIWHDTQDVTEGWESLIAMSEQFSDDDTGITKYTQGTDAQHLNDTATGISMIMNASSLPIKEVLGNIDEMWIEEMIEDLMDWNLENLTAETVKTLLGEKHAQNWQAVLDYGKTNFMEWFATGSQTFMAKEVLMHKLQGYLTLVLSSELAASKIDITELLQQVWDAGQIGKESPVLTDEDLQKQQQQGQQGQQIMQHAQQAIDGVKQQAQEAIKQKDDEVKAAQEAAAKAGMENQMKELDHQKADLDMQRRLADLEEQLAAEKFAAQQLQKTVELEREMFKMKELVTAHDMQAAHDAEKSAAETTTQAKADSSDATDAALVEALKALSAPKKRTAEIVGPSGAKYVLTGTETMQ